MDNVDTDLSETDSYDTDSSDTETNDIYFLSNDDITELTITIYELFDEYIQSNLLQSSSSKFYIEMINYVSEIIFADLYEDGDDFFFDELFCFIEQVSDVFLDCYIVPRRTTTIPLEKSSEYLSRLNEHIKRLEQLPQPEQRTPEWYEFRYNLITASNLNKVFGTDAAVNSLICEKCKPLSYVNSFSGVNTNSSLHWGVKYEPVSVMVYEHKFNTRVGEFGCIQHPQYSFIGASPDGINIDPMCERYGRMLEIKNIVNRDITGIPKDEYWVQTQIQMETCNLDECDFVETRFKEFENETAFYEDMTREYKGVMLQFYEKINMENTHSLSPVYKYMPFSIQSIVETEIWINSQNSEMREQNYVLQSTIYWYLDEISCVLIPRNKQWFGVAVSKIENVWNTILTERVGGYQHRMPKKKIVDIFVETDKPIKTLCLIRLDENGNII